MKIQDIVSVLAQKVIDTIYDEWHHDGHIEHENPDSFSCDIDGKKYRIYVSLL